MVNRADVVWVDFGKPKGSEPGFIRPALVVSSDRFNRSRIATVIVAPITSNITLAQAPGNVALKTGDADLPKPSVVNVSQLHVVDRSRLSSTIGTLPTHLMKSVDSGIRLVLNV